MFQKKPVLPVVWGIGVKNDGESLASNPDTLDGNLYVQRSHPNSATKTRQADLDASRRLARMVQKLIFGEMGVRQPPDSSRG